MQPIFELKITPDAQIPIRDGRIILDAVDGKEHLSIDFNGERIVIAEKNRGTGGGNDAREVLMSGQPFVVSNPYAGVPVGTVIESEKDLYALLRWILRPIERPVYHAPTLSLAGTTPFAREIGSHVDTTLTPTWTQNDAGALAEYRLRRGAEVIYTGTAPVAQTESFQLIANTSFNAQADFSDGPIKQDSAGNDDDYGRIMAGTITSNTLTYTPFRRAFFSALNEPEHPLTSDEVRDLPQSMLNPQNGTQITIEVNPGQRGCVFCYPQSLRTPSSIIQISLGMNVVDWFTEINMPVHGANDFAAVMYRVFYLIPEFPFSTTEHYRLTI